MTRFHGTFQGQTDSGPGVLPVLVILALLLLGGGGAVAGAIYEAGVLLVYAAGGILVLLAAAVAAFAVHRRRHPETRLVPRPQFHGFSEPQAVRQPQRPQIVQNFYGGNHVHATDPVRVRGEIGEIGQP